MDDITRIELTWTVRGETVWPHFVPVLLRQIHWHAEPVMPLVWT